MKINGNDLTSFQLIYSQTAPGMKEIAESLAQLFEEALGVKLACVTDECEASGCEFLVGPTNRPLSVDCYTTKKVAPMTVRLIVDGNTVQLACGGACSANAFLKELKEALNGSVDELKDGTYFECELVKPESVPLTADSTLRVMTSNVLAHWWEGNRGYPTVANRAEMYVATLNVYQPDLIGIQETDAAWLSDLPYYLDYLRAFSGGLLDYEWIENTYMMPTGDRVPNLTSLIYRKDRFELVESGSLPFSYAKEPKYKCRMRTWGVFEDRESQEKYVLVNTHWSFTAEETWIGIREECALIDAKKLRYPGIHVFCTGDFNNHLNKSIEKFQVESGLFDSKDEAKKNGSLINENPGIPEGIYIDHVFFNEGMMPRRHETVDAGYTKKMSDHMFQYGDFLVK